MGKINDTTKYTYDTPSISDYLIGTDGDLATNKTRNYKIQDVIALFPVDSQGFDQNNIGIRLDLGLLSEGETISEKFDAISEFEINPREIYIVSLYKQEILIPNSPTPVLGLVSIPVPYPLPTPTVQLKLYKYLFAKGKGFYGVSVSNPTVTTDADDFIEISMREVNLNGTTSATPIVNNIVNPTSQIATVAINTAGTFVINTNQDVYFKVNNIGGYGNYVIYRFIGVSGTYGVGGTQVVSGDLLDIEAYGVATTPTTNIKINESIPYFVPYGTTKATILNDITFTVTQNEILIFNFTEVLTPPLAKKQIIQSASYFFKRGKGTYGGAAEVPPIANSDLKLNFKEVLQSVFTDLPTIYVGLDQEEQENAVDSINNRVVPIVKDGLSTIIVEKLGVRYEFVAANGTYGFGQSQIVINDLVELATDDKDTSTTRENVKLLTALNIKSGNTTPIDLGLPEPEIDEIYIITDIIGFLDYGTVAFDLVEMEIITDTATVAQWRVDNTFLSATEDVNGFFQRKFAFTGKQFIAGKKIFVKTSANSVGGDGTVMLYFSYRIQKV